MHFIRISKESNMIAHNRIVIQQTSETCEDFGVTGSNYELTESMES